MLSLLYSEMALLRYFKQKDGLPDPRGALSLSMPSSAIAQANTEVQKAIDSEKPRKRGPYKRYSSTIRAEIGKYASHHGVAAAARYFSRKCEKSVSETTVRSIRSAYLQGRRKRTAELDEEDAEIIALPLQKRGRPVLLGQELDSQVQMYLKKVREGGGAVSARIVMAAARGILLKCDRSKLVEFGGYIELNRQWAHSLLKRMKFVQRKATTAKSKETEANFVERKKLFLADVVATVTMEEIPPELILNWDQTGIKIVPCSTWTMDRRGVKRVEMIGANDKRQITAIFCGTLTGDFLPVQVIYKGKTSRCHPRFAFPPEWHITHSPKHWSTELTMVQYVEHIIVPYVEKVRESHGDDTPALVIMDNFKGQITESFLSLLDGHNIHVCLLPPNTTDRLQPMDISVNKPAKDYLRRQFDQWYSEQVLVQLEGEGVADLEALELQPINLAMPAMKELGAKWLVNTVTHISENPQVIVNGFIHSGITGALDGQEAADPDVPEGDQELDSDDYFDESQESDTF